LSSLNYAPYLNRLIGNKGSTGDEGQENNGFTTYHKLIYQNNL